MKKLFLLISSTLLIFSCAENDDFKAPVLEEFEQGYFIINEGGFQNGNASLSFTKDFETITNDIFLTKNKEALGDTAQSALIEGNLMYIVMNKSNKIQIVNRKTLEKVGEITEGLENPRYSVIRDGKLYTTNWGDANVDSDDYISVHDTSDFTFIENIEFGSADYEGPEKITVFDNKLYVLHKGGWGYNSIVSSISITTQTITKIELSDLPDSFAVHNGYLYVLCAGKPSWVGATDAKLWKIKDENSVFRIFDYEDTSGTVENASNLTIVDDKIYFTSGGIVYSWVEGNSITEAEEFINQELSSLYYVNGNLLGINASYSEQSDVYVYDLDGEQIGSFKSGIGSNQILWNE
ncbi:MAG: hypothetical protein H6604_05900 [Flavobacteriales bacterium]|nr:hypothetical protein [Flavobacteriales bacterium]